MVVESRPGSKVRDGCFAWVRGPVRCVLSGRREEMTGDKGRENENGRESESELCRGRLSLMGMYGCCVAVCLVMQEGSMEESSD